MNKSIKKIRNAIFFAILIIFSFIQVFPFYLKIIESLQPNGFIPELGKIYLLPEKFSFVNYIDAWKMSSLGKGYLNSLIYVTIYTVVSAMIALLVGYILAKKSFKGRKFIFVILISTMMVPGEVLMIPNFILIRDIGLYDSLAALIIPGLVNTFGIFLARQFMLSIPDATLEAAHVDGAGEMSIFTRIVLPTSFPVIATYFILTYTAMWNEYLWPMIMLNNPDAYPVQLALKVFEPRFATAYDQTLMSAGMITTLAPIIAVFLIFQKRFVEGISLSGIK